MAYFEHICEGGERWDTLAQQFYNDARKMHVILAANPQLISPGPTPLVLKKGMRVIVPVLQEEAAPVSVPPWRA
ncbi:hypothetical protein AN189_13120 [Loktanella sp. 3ANDIMAR09]|uniref:tail protein X n=1 Tax=Loktanella sp. 3ANDIMAR09 TaxID=1225657 RepID=UPI0007020786|nr:tail protein X [Loktanella sp. 3ANDIMAR09]KQI68002.1 hypothetical protein AN189_13120 [Loktanella sp. 3ANDIMAR09]